MSSERGVAVEPPIASSCREVEMGESTQYNERLCTGQNTTLLSVTFVAIASTIPTAGNAALRQRIASNPSSRAAALADHHGIGATNSTNSGGARSRPTSPPRQQQQRRQHRRPHRTRGLRCAVAATAVCLRRGEHDFGFVAGEVNGGDDDVAAVFFAEADVDFAFNAGGEGFAVDHHAGDVAAVFEVDADQAGGVALGAHTTSPSILS